MKRITQALLAVAALALVSANPPEKLKPLPADDPADVKTLRDCWGSGAIRTDAQGDVIEVIAAQTGQFQNHPELEPALSRLHHVRDLVASGISVDQPLLSAIKSWSTLEGLSLTGDVSDDGLADIENLQGLTSLSIYGSQYFTDEGLKHIRNLKNLRDLTIRGSAIRGRTLSHLAGLAKLRTLDLRGSRINDDGVKNLKGMALEKLDVSNTRITDRSADDLRQITTLKVLDVNDTKLTNASLSKLKAIPGLKLWGLPREEIHEVPDDPADVAAIKAAGIGMTIDNVTDNVHCIDGTGYFDSLSWMVHLKGLHSVEEFVVPLEAKDGDLADIEGMTSLRILRLPWWATDSGLKHIRKLTGLKQLSIRCRGVKGPGLVNLSDMKNLESLDLTGAFVGDDGLANLPNLKHLHALILDRTAVTDAGLTRLDGLSELENLGLCNTAVTNAGLSNLRSLKGLTRIGFSGSKITDGGLKQLKSKYCPKLPVFVKAEPEVHPAGATGSTAP